MEKRNKKVEGYRKAITAVLRDDKVQNQVSK